MKKKISIIISLFFLSFICIFANFVSQKDEVKELEVYDVLAEDISIDESGEKIVKNKNKNQEANNKVSNVLAQVSPETDGKRSVRVLAGLDSYLYNNAKFDIVVKDGENIFKTFENNIVTRAYTHVVASGMTYSASEAFGEGYNYLVAFTVNNVPEYAWGYTFEIVVSIRKTTTDAYTSSNVGYKVMKDMIAADEELEAQKVELNATLNNAAAGNIVGTGKFLPNSNVTLSVEENEGFVFVGWYEGNEVVSNEKTLSFKMPEENISYDAKFAQKTSDTVYEFEGVVYSIISKELSVTGYTDDIACDVVILSMLDGYEVTNIKSTAFYNCSVLESIVIPEGIKSIGASAFFKSVNLKNIEIPNSVTSIESGAFLGCSGLTNVSLPKGLTNIGVAAFQGCSNLESIIIPEGVTYIGGSAFLKCSNLKNVKLCNNIKNIMDSTFEGCSSLTNITIPNSVTSIGDYAFKDCSSLVNIVVPDSVTSIGISAFKGCSSLQSITLPFVGQYLDGSGKTKFASIFGELDNIAYRDVPATLKEVIITGGTNIGDSAFSSCNNISSIALPNNITSIGEKAFYNCTSLASITISENVKNIQNDAFYGCDSLKDVYYYGTSVEWCNLIFSNINSTPLRKSANLYMLNDNNWHEITSIEVPNTITSIGNYQFCGFKNLTNITIPDSIISIGNSAFEDCSSLESVYYSGTIENWCNFDFEYNASPMSYASHFNMLDENKEWYEVTSIEVPNTVSVIGDYQFYNFKNVISIILPEGVTSIGDYAFQDCSNLTSITIPDSVTSIGKSAFTRCSNLERIILPEEGVTSIGNNAFSNCSNLERIILPEGVTNIGVYAFAYCGNLTSIIIPNSVTNIGREAFSGCSSLTSVIIPGSVISIGEKAFYNCIKLSNITICNGVTNVGSYAFQGCVSIKNVEIPNSVTSIGTQAFRDCSSLESITIPFIGMTLNGVVNTTFGHIFGAPYSGGKIPSSLREVIVTGGTSIADGAFEDCSNLTSITIPNSVTSIGSRAFKDCSVTSFIIPEGVTSIGNGAFSGCDNLESITIPESITNIDNSAFWVCVNLKTVYYNGTIEEWNNITFSNNDSNPMSYASTLYVLDENGEYYDATSLIL